MRVNNLTSVEAYGYFLQRVHQIVFKYNRTVVNWVEAFERLGTKLDKRTVVHVWKARGEFEEVLNAGYRVLLSDSSQWYLTGGHVTHNWTVMYNNEPLDGIKPEQTHQVLGGEVCAWSEYLDPGNFEGTIFPRASAAAEKLWSPREVNSTGLALPRLAAFRCDVLNHRGIGAAALRSNDNPVDGSPELTVTGPPGIGACLDQ